VTSWIHRRHVGACLLALAAWVAPQEARADDDADSREESADSSPVTPESAPEVFQELFLGEAPFTEEPGELQPIVNVAGRRRAAASSLSASAGLEAGITEHVEVEVEVPFEVYDARRTAAGPTNVELGLKYSLYSSAARRLAIAAGIAGSAPSLSDGVGEEAYGYEALLAIYKGLGALHLNVTLRGEVEHPVDPGEKVGAQAGGALAVLAPIGSVVPLIEARVDAGRDTEWTGALGVLWHPSPAWEIGAAGLASIAEGGPGYGANVILTFEWEPGGDAAADPEPTHARALRGSNPLGRPVGRR